MATDLMAKLERLLDLAERRLLSYELLMARTSSGTTVRRLLIYGLLLARTSSDKNVKRPRKNVVK